MAGISVGEAFSSGFRLIGREPKAVATWLVAYLVFTVALWGLMLLAAPSLLSESAALGRAGAEVSAAQAEELVASMSGLWAVLPVIVLLSLVFSAAFLGAIYRAVLQPDDRRLAYLRFGRRELMLLLSAIVWALFMVVVYMVIIMGSALVGGLIGAGLTAAGAPSALSGLCSGVAVLIGLLLTLWVFMRLVVSLPMAFDQARFLVFEGWRATRGAGWPMLGLGVALILIVTVLEVVLWGLFFIGAGALSLSAPGTAASMMSSPPVLILGLVVMSLVGTVVYVVVAAPAAEVYRQLRGEDASVFS